MSPLEIATLVVVLWCAPAVVLSAFVAYHAWFGTWGDASTPYDLYLERLYEVEQERAMASERHGGLAVEADRASIQHGTPLRKGQASPQTSPAA